MLVYVMYYIYVTSTNSMIQKNTNRLSQSVGHCFMAKRKHIMGVCAEKDLRVTGSM